MSAYREYNNKTSLEKWLNLPIKKLKTVLRWGDFKNHKQKENTLEHTIKQTLLTIVAIIIEYGEKATNDPFFILVTAALIHDFGERPKGKINKKTGYDRSVEEKNNGDKESMQNEERKIMYNYLDSLPITDSQIKDLIIDFFIKAYELQYDLDNPLGKYFNSLEKIGYITHAIDECLEKNTEYSKVLQDHYTELLEYSKKFKSINFLFSENKNYIDYLLRPKQ
ncbi:MAG: YfbR-like 5'-deoxynucleotidase [Patescibacteria group bacterium]